ncbi:expressed unknown protein [Seminavis robusta]|uniref:Uncharacterized protein n=1 Tax=Seminavis robusta TaxID=568900 RepID=A0A9N8HT14_9STRA|nr:expressed unknown protein [Seminavis robusta]|eukprot:Sro1453_g274000.1 n/a (378) ;mRNA; r:9536-10669
MERDHYQSQDDNEEFSSSSHVRHLSTARSSSRSFDRYETDEDFASYHHSFCSDDNNEDDDSSFSSCAIEEIANKLSSSNSQDFLRLELDDEIGDVNIDSLIMAMESRTVQVREVAVHIDAMENLSQAEQKRLANAICQLSELRSLLVYKNSLLFLEPLLYHQPIQLATLRLCKLDMKESQNADLLVSVLQQMQRLKTLDVTFDNTTSEGVSTALSRMAPIMASLESFRVDYRAPEETCTLDNAIVRAIAQVVQHSETLKSLSLPPLSLTEHGHQALIQMLERNCFIERIEIWVRVGQHLYYPDTNEALDRLLKLNRSGVRQLLRQDNNISCSEDILPILTSHQHGDDLDTIFHLFSSKPSLLPLSNYNEAMAETIQP